MGKKFCVVLYRALKEMLTKEGGRIPLDSF